jgi:hypothetical protein
MLLTGNTNPYRKAAIDTRRVLICRNCTAYFGAPVSGGAVRCESCGWHGHVPSRPDSTTVRGRPRDERARLAKLQTQIGDSYELPPTLVHLLYGGVLNPAFEADAWREWLTALSDLERRPSPGVELRAFHLGYMLLRQHEQNVWRRRAVVETTLEAISDANLAQECRASLAVWCDDEGDPGGAQFWLDQCDPYSEDIRADTAYRAAHSRLALRRRDFVMVLEMLGDEIGDVPLHESSEAMLGLRRAHAHEELHDSERAYRQVCALARTTPDVVLHKIRDYHRENGGVELCPKAFARLLAGKGDDSEEEEEVGFWEVLGGCWHALALGLCFLIASFVVGPEATTDDGMSARWFLLMFALPWLAYPAVAFATWLFAKKRNSEFHERALSTTGEVLSVEQTGTYINNQPELVIHLLVDLPGHVKRKITLKKVVELTELAFIQPGARIPLLVNPNA